LRTFAHCARRETARALVRTKLQTTSGATLEDLLLGEGIEDLQLRSDDG
jgi:hypothetical protein